jgi:gluconolactonase
MQMGVSVSDAEGRDLIRADTDLELIRSGFKFIEGPAWSAAGFLVFSDIVGDQMWRWDEREGFQSYRQPSHMANGNTFDREGRLISCEHATSRVTREEADGSTTVLASHYEGTELNSPNDVIVSSHGTIYFSDPTYGRTAGFGVLRRPRLGFQGVYSLDTEGTLSLLARDFAQPNGLCFSRDESVLFVNDTDRMHIRSFAVSADGTLSGGEVWAETIGDGPGGPDGMKIDSYGNVWCTGPGGIHVFAPDASLLGVLPVPESVGNFGWGGDDFRSLFVCASTGLYRQRTEVAGHAPHRGVDVAAD